MSLNTYLPSTVIESAKHNADHQGLADGTNDTDTNSMSKTRLSAFRDWVDTGLVIGTSVNLTSVTSTGAAYVNGKRPNPVATSKTYTASKDTYVYLKDDGTYSYAEVANNTTSPTATLNSDSTNAILIAIVITSGSAITSVNQGSESATAPTVASNVLTVCDSLGHVIYNRSAGNGVIGYRQFTSDFTSTATGADTDITGLNVTVIGLTNRKLKITVGQYYQASTAIASTFIETSVLDVTSSVEVGRQGFTLAGASFAQSPRIDFITTPPLAGARNYKVRFKTNNAGTYKMAALSTAAAFIRVEIV